ncbi:MAG: PIN domain-containing protein [Anaerolineae bacterium]|nr:PIN domain-containing protein [Anaerolineae bacterium]
MNVAENGGLFFLDTNLFVYAQATNEPQKQPVAAVLIAEALRTGRGVISTQVIQEFLNVAIRKALPAFSPDEATDYLYKVLWPLCGHFPSRSFYERALQVRNATGYAFYDALIVTAAVESGCRTLYSEDLQHGRTIQGLSVVNPFLGLP